MLHNFIICIRWIPTLGLLGLYITFPAIEYATENDNSNPQLKAIVDFFR